MIMSSSAMMLWLVREGLMIMEANRLEGGEPMTRVVVLDGTPDDGTRANQE